MLKKNSKIIIVGNGYKNSISDSLFRDVIEGKINNVEYLYIWDIKNPIIRFIQKRYYSRKWNFFEKIPFFQKFFKKYNAFEKIKKENTKGIVVVNLASQYSNLITKEDLIELKKSGQVLVLMCIDSINSPQMNSGDIISWFPLFDIVISDNPEDAARYNLYYHMDPYPWKREEVDCNSIKNDLYFFGRGKGRADLCKNLNSFLSSNGIICDFTIVDLEKDITKNIKKGFEEQGVQITHSKVPYSQILDDIGKTNCILELISHDNGASLRYFESIVFNKKLITNNQKAYLLPFYNPKYMKIIKTPEDVDVEWLKERVEVNYNYNNDFSVNSFIMDLRNELLKRGIIYETEEN